MIKKKENISWIEVWKVLFQKYVTSPESISKILRVTVRDARCDDFCSSSNFLLDWLGLARHVKFGDGLSFNGVMISCVIAELGGVGQMGLVKTDSHNVCSILKNENIKLDVRNRMSVMVKTK